MKKIITLLLAGFLSLYFPIYGQYNNIWMLSIIGGINQPYYGLDFTNGTPDTFTVNRNMSIFNTNSSLCDTSGNILFYSNGIYIANRLHDTLQNSAGFNPGYNTNLNSLQGLNMPQAVVFLPYPGHPNQYVLIHESSDTITVNLQGLIYHKVAPLTLRYSIIDMTLGSGLGGILPNRKSIVLFSDTLTVGKLSACKHANGRDWWILAQRYNDSLFYKILITPDTIEVSSQQAGFASHYDFFGQALFSPDGSKYVMDMQDWAVDVFDFDRCDGSLSNHQHLNNLLDTNWAYLGASISPDNHYLYLSTNFFVFQYDLLASVLDSTVQIVAVNDTFQNPTACLFFMHSLGPDGKIYISTYDGTYSLHVIAQPNSFGLGCDVQQHSITLPGPGGNMSVPTFPNYNLGPLIGSPCDTLTGIATIIKEKELSLTITPNPLTDGILHIRYMLPQNKAGTLTVRDVTGKVVYTYRLPQWSTLQNLRVGLAEGVYFCTVTSGDYRVSKKVVVIKE